MDSESKVIPFPKIELKNLEFTENLDPLEYSSIPGFQRFSPQEIVKNNPEIARAFFESAQEQYNIAIQNMGFLEELLENQYHTAEIIDAKDPAIWKNKANNKEY